LLWQIHFLNQLQIIIAADKEFDGAACDPCKELLLNTPVKDWKEVN
jgi:hypothetical protein